MSSTWCRRWTLLALPLTLTAACLAQEAAPAAPQADGVAARGSTGTAEAQADRAAGPEDRTPAPAQPPADAGLASGPAPSGPPPSGDEEGPPDVPLLDRVWPAFADERTHVLLGFDLATIRMPLQRDPALNQARLGVVGRLVHSLRTDDTAATRQSDAQFQRAVGVRLALSPDLHVDVAYARNEEIPFLGGRGP